LYFCGCCAWFSRIRRCGGAPAGALPRICRAAPRAREGSGAVHPGQRPSVGRLRHGDPWQVLWQTGQRRVIENVQNVHA